jgi:hypothetical protein
VIAIVVGGDGALWTISSESQLRDLGSPCFLSLAIRLEKIRDLPQNQLQPADRDKFLIQKPKQATGDCTNNGIAAEVANHRANGGVGEANCTPLRMGVDERPGGKKGKCFATFSVPALPERSTEAPKKSDVPHSWQSPPG